jgi:hypothetical protein
MKNSIDTIGNRTRDPPPPACGVVLVPPRRPKIVMFAVHNSCVCGVGNLAALSNQFRSAIHWLRTARLPFSGHLLMSCNRVPSSNQERPAGRPSTLYCLRRLDVSVAAMLVKTHTYQKLELKSFFTVIPCIFDTIKYFCLCNKYTVGLF